MSFNIQKKKSIGIKEPYQKEWDIEKVWKLQDGCQVCQGDLPRGSKISSGLLGILAMWVGGWWVERKFQKR